jgi:hypothetical protein
MFDLYSDDQGQMNRDLCAMFIRSVTGSKVDSDDEMVDNFFKKHDTNNDDKIERADFLRFYESSSLSIPDTVRKNLKTHNIRPDLKKLSEA